MLLVDFGYIIRDGFENFPNFLIEHLSREMKKAKDLGFTKEEFIENIRCICEYNMDNERMRLEMEQEVLRPVNSEPISRSIKPEEVPYYSLKLPNKDEIYLSVVIYQKDLVKIMKALEYVANSQLNSGNEIDSEIKWAGSKTDLIRLLNAIYELHLVGGNNSKPPSKIMFMEKAGAFFGLNLKSYSTFLTQSENEDEDVCIKIFEDMKEVTILRVNEKINKKQ